MLNLWPEPVFEASTVGDKVWRRFHKVRCSRAISPVEKINDTRSGAVSDKYTKILSSPCPTL